MAEDLDLGALRHLAVENVYGALAEMREEIKKDSPRLGAVIYQGMVNRNIRYNKFPLCPHCGKRHPTV